MERIVVIYGAVVACLFVYAVASAPAKREKLRQERQALADEIVGRLRG